MDASTISKGQSAEKTEGREKNLPGVYRNKDTGKIFITAEGEEGSIQADALLAPIWKDVWEWEAEVPNRIELLKLRKTQEINDAKAEAAEKKAEKVEIKAAMEEDVKLPVGGETYEPAKAK